MFYRGSCILVFPDESTWTSKFGLISCCIALTNLTAYKLTRRYTGVVKPKISSKPNVSNPLTILFSLTTNRDVPGLRSRYNWVQLRLSHGRLRLLFEWVFCLPRCPEEAERTKDAL